MKPDEEHHTVSFLACVLRSPDIILWGFLPAGKSGQNYLAVLLLAFKEAFTLYPLPHAPSHMFAFGAT